MTRRYGAVSPCCPERDKRNSLEPISTARSMRRVCGIDSGRCGRRATGHHRHWKRLTLVVARRSVFACPAAKLGNDWTSYRAQALRATQHTIRAQLASLRQDAGKSRVELPQQQLAARCDATAAAGGDSRPRSSSAVSHQLCLLARNADKQPNKNVARAVHRSYQASETLARRPRQVMWNE